MNLLLRTVLVRAVMHLIGDRNWWLPRGLDCALPRVAVKGAESESARCPAASPVSHDAVARPGG